MNDTERWCLSNLERACVDVDFIQKTHQISWPPDVQFHLDFHTWLGLVSQSAPCDQANLNRFNLERFLRSQRLLTRAYAAARLAIQPESFDQLLPLLPRLGLSKKYAVYPGIIDESLAEDLVKSLPGLRFRTFGTHDSFCELLHHALGKAVDLEVKPLFCFTADELGEQRMYAYTWDNITLRPLSAKHSVRLDFQKPLSLAPDLCSKLFLAQHWGELKPFLAGHDAPRDLAKYVEIAEKSA